ncbi:conserved hypothetical protein [Nostocoides japonicum T1-X7]|uniref:AbiEi antitoxin C-terminal domain-containing protein n=1 Tax=Nostocoides japonicum T1-X7 TaxID=1194083 RepID=A0A077M124_9MICO|nr:hypothetical protein [Tetrasphaera japonica]CCH77889.1 conserved hypothetical protein [Tetrasphaera japonica T1-X7]
MGVDWAQLRKHADAQCDLLTRSQCLQAGLTDGTIQHRLRSGRWLTAHPGVYLTAPGRRDWFVRAMGLFLYAGNDAAFCGASAAHWWALEKKEPATVELAIPHGQRMEQLPGAQITRRRDLDKIVDEREFPWRTRVPVTVVDVAAAGTPDSALATVARAVQQARVTVGELRTELARRGRCGHGRLLREVLADVDEGVESTAELRYVKDVERAHGLPSAQRQVATHHGAARRHDNRYAAYRLVVEVDGRLGHETWEDRIRDGQRDRQVLPAEGVTLRVFWPDVAVSPCATAVEIGAALTAGGWSGRVRRCRRSGCVVPRG